MKALHFLVICAFFSASFAVTVRTKYGLIEGHSVTLSDGKILNSFLGVPYAKPPVGNLRFKPPEEPDPWTETFVADELSPVCPQGRGIGLLWMTHPGWDSFDEDCLTMNIVAPNNTATKGPYPVMYWIHGGGYSGSANIQYPGHFLAAKDVVVVVINYRLSALGFMSTESPDFRGNYGLWDQVRGLEFVRDNIAAFGGDPGKVTIFGQSAGGSSSSLMQFNSKAKGLFHQIIAESGSDLALWAVNEGKPHGYTRQVAAKLNCSTDDIPKMMECLRTKHFDEVIRPGFTREPGYFSLGFVPVVDGPGGALPDVPLTLREKGDYYKVPSIIGHTKEDGSIYLAGFFPSAWDRGFNQTEFEDILHYGINYFAPRFKNPDVEGGYEALKFYYSPWPHLNDEKANRDKLTEVVTDAAWGVPDDIQAKFVSGGKDGKTTYYYVLGYRSVNANSTYPNWMGALHNAELPYVWGYPLLQNHDDVRYDSSIWFDIIDWNQEDIEYVEFVQTLWTNFAKYGNPTPKPVPGPIGNRPQTWKTFTANELNYLAIDRDVRNTVNYRQRNLAFWREYMYWLIYR